MLKKVLGDIVYYSIAWSPIFEYDKHSASRILPELPGILFYYNNERKISNKLLVYACWRNGLRMAMRDLMDPLFASNDHLYKTLKEISSIQYKYCVIDTSQSDVRDVMYWLITEHQPLLNTQNVFKDSRRYREISVMETDLAKNEIKMEASRINF